MKILLLSVLLYSNNPKIDTIDFWHIYYDDLKVKELNITSQERLVNIKIYNIKKTDSLIIKYFKDVPCFDCKIQATVENETRLVITQGKNIGTFSPLKISLFQLVQYHSKTKKKIFHLFFNEYGERPQRTFLLKIRLE